MTEQPSIRQQKQDPPLVLAPIYHSVHFLLYSYPPILPIPAHTSLLKTALVRAYAPPIQ